MKDSLLQKNLIKRSRIIQSIRDFFVSEGFLEVQTPILVKYAGQEPYLDPMKVEGLGYLITSPEYSHKKLLAQGFKKTFEITKCFRNNEPLGGLHNPEFTMLEWYRSHADYTDIMEDVENLIQYVIRNLILQNKRHGNFQFPISNFQQNVQCSISNFKRTILRQGRTIDISSPWERITVHEAFEKYVGVSKYVKIHDREFLRGLCVERGYTVGQNDTYDDLFFRIFLTEIEPKLGFEKPTILYDYPAQMASLARLKTSPQPSPAGRGRKGEGQWAERFELYIAGIEIANAFSELNNAKDQRKRFLQEQKLRKKLGKEIIPIDKDFLKAVGNMPPAAGIALGVDRLIMLLLGAKSVAEIMAFPTCMGKGLSK